MNTSERKTKKQKTLDIDAGLSAFEQLATSEVVEARPATARDLVFAGIKNIMKARARGVPMLRIYTDACQASGMKISYRSFCTYVSLAAKAAGLQKEKTVRQRPVTGGGQWQCASCPSSTRRESKKSPGNFFWMCPSCKTFYHDNAGKLTSKRF